MAAKRILNGGQVLGVTGVNLATLNAQTTSGNSQEIYLTSVDTVRFYLDITAVSGSGTIKFELDERNPQTGSFFACSDKDAVSGTALNSATGGIFNTTGFTGTTSNVLSTLDPCYGEAYQVKWTISGFTSVTFGISLLVNDRNG